MTDEQSILRAIENAHLQGLVEAVPAGLRKAQKRTPKPAVGKSLPVPEFAVLRQRGLPSLIVKGKQ